MHCDCSLKATGAKIIAEAESVSAKKSRAGVRGKDVSGQPGADCLRAVKS